MVFLVLLFYFQGFLCNHKGYSEDPYYLELVKSSKSSSVIRLKESTFVNVFERESRSYSAVVMITLSGYSLPKIFLNLESAFMLLADSYKKGNYSKKVFFAKVSSNGFAKKYCELNNLNMMPIILYFPSKFESLDVQFYDIRYEGANVHKLKFWIQANTLVEIDLVRSASMAGILKLLIFSACLLCFIYLMRDFIVKMNNRKTWKYAATFFIIVMLSGFMLNRIHGIPLLSYNTEGGSLFGSGGRRDQYGIECIIIAVTYTFMSFSFIYILKLRRQVPMFKSLRMGQDLLGLVVFGVSCFIFARVIKLKIPYYPLFL